LDAIITISPSINSNFSSSWMTPASIMRPMSSTVNARRGNPSAAVVVATTFMRLCSRGRGNMASRGIARSTICCDGASEHAEMLAEVEPGLPQLRSGAADGHPAAVQDHDVVGDVERELWVLLHQND